VKTKIKFTLILLIFFSLLSAQTTGKIKGVVTDENGEPLPCTYVVVEGTTWGAEADEDGYYTIFGVRAGTYTLKAEYLGYEFKEINDVKVRVGLTTTHNFKMINAGNSYITELNTLKEKVIDSADDVIYLLDSTKQDLNYKISIVEKQSDKKLLRKISFGSYDDKIKIAALKHIEDTEVLYEFYKTYISGNKDNFVLFYEDVIAKLPENILIQIYRERKNYDELGMLERNIKDQGIIIKYIREFKDSSLLSNLKNLDTIKELFWEIGDDKFRIGAIPACRSINKTENYNFLVKIFKEIISDEVKIRALWLADDDLSFFVNYFQQDVSDKTKERIIREVYLQVLINDEHPLKAEAEKFLDKVLNDNSLPESVRTKAEEILLQSFERDMNLIKDEGVILILIKKEKIPKRVVLLLSRYEQNLREKYLNYLFKKVDKKKYYKKMNNLVEDYIDDVNTLDIDIFLKLLRFTTDEKLLGDLYDDAVDNNRKLPILITIKDDNLINKVVKKGNLDQHGLKIAFTKLKDQTLIKDMLKKYSGNSELRKILVWRCNNEKILNEIIETAQDDTLALSCEMKIDLLRSDADNVLNTFFDEWQKIKLPPTGNELKNYSKTEIAIHELCDVIIDNFFNEHLEYYEEFNNKYYIFPSTIRCSIDSVANESDIPNYNIKKERVNITNFKPFTQKLEGKSVYYDKLYEKVIIDFIKYCLVDYKIFRINNESDDYDDRFGDYRDFPYTKQEFYNNELISKRITSCISWRGGFSLDDYPYIEYITFNKELTKAVIDLWYGNTGEGVVYIKQNGIWKYSHQLYQSHG
jgi:hypothetical protein